jgi:hypothetical protein
VKATRRQIWFAVLSGLCLAPIFVLVAFDLTWFYPRLQAARAKVDMAGVDAFATDSLLFRLINAAEPAGVGYPVARIVSIQPGPGRAHFTQGQWNTYGTLSNLLVSLHCGQEEQLRIYASLAYVGRHGYGLQSASQGMYATDLAHLSPAQLSTVVAIANSPGRFGRNPEALATRARMLAEMVASDH